MKRSTGNQGSLRDDLRSNSRVFQAVVFAVFSLLAALILIVLFVHVDLFIKGPGTITNRAQIMVVNKMTGILEKIEIRKDGKVLEGQVIAWVRRDGGRSPVMAPRSGEYLSVSEGELVEGQEVHENRIFGMVLKQGTFFEALVNEHDILEIKDGQDCIFRLTAFENDGLPPLSGKVFCISDVPVSQDNKSYFPVFCIFEADGQLGGKFRLGMSGIAEIRVGRETIFNFLLGRKKRTEK